VVRAPEEVAMLAGSESLVQTVDVPPIPSGKDDETMSFAVGPDNPDFVSYDKLSPYLVAAIMTTEDSGFFKHRGWVSAQFKTALKRNLAGGGFRLGASSITMQMVKNLLLSREKTLSRKFQELFLVWYVEQILTKERILELYFNAIEFGPRLYGIGAAARHYFGKSAADLNPLESAFFSSILPSPKRRYVQYCHGTLTPQWEKFVHRILSRMHERGRLNEDEFATANASTLVFDKAEMTMTEKQCMDWVRRITARPEPEPEPEPDGQ
jgi:membrane peptidoglycan carboxypeptidase